jgi:putative SOS response-associated peptidase YedK
VQVNPAHACQLGKQVYAAINARADRVQTAPTCREPFRKRRCLVPASG